MGLFSRKPKIPKPQVSIVLGKGCEGPFRPGGRIAGTVTLQSPVQRPISLGTAKLYGHSVTHSRRTEGSGNTNRTITYHDDTILFCFDQTLSQSVVVEQDLVYSWQFEFVLPETSDPIVPARYVGKTESSGVYSNQSHPLPPTFKYERSNNFYALVEYTVQAVFQFDDGTDPFVMDLPPLEVILEPLASIPPALVEYVKPAEQYSSSRLIGEEKSFKHSFRDKFSSQTPRIKLVMKSSIDTNLTSSGVFPIYACVEIDSFSDSSISIPSIEIRITSIKICQITFWRALKVRGSSSRKEHETIEEDKVLLNAVPDRITAAPQQGLEQGRKFTYFPATFEARVPGATCPSFQTCNINHNFQLRLTLEADVCGKTFEHEIDVLNAIVHPG